MSIAFVQYQKVNASSVAAVSAVAIGDLIWVATQGTAAGTPTVSDTVNSGNYNFLGTFSTLTSDLVNVFWIRCNAAGTPTISCTGVAINRLAFGHYNGFINNATVLTGDVAHSTTATATAYDSTAFSCSQNNEHAFGVLDGSGQNSASNSAQFSNLGGDANLRGFDTVGGSGPFTAGTSVDLSGTFSVASNSFALIFGFYDAAAGAALAGAASAASRATAALTSGFGPFAQILLDNASHVGGSDQIFDGAVANDGTGDQARTAFIKLKQWATDLNTMLGQLFGNTVTYASASGSSNDVNPSGFAPNTSRLDVTLGSGVATWTGLQYGADNQRVILRNADATNSLTLNVNSGSSQVGNRFAGIGTLVLPPGDAVMLCYYSSISQWVFV